VFPFLLILAGAAAYHASFGVPFLADDKSEILYNLSLRSFEKLGSYVLAFPSRQLVHLSFALNYQWGGLDVRGYHLVNLAIHLLAGLVLYGVVRRTLRQREDSPRAYFIGFGTALIWIIHPLQTESVTYLSQRAESMMGLFYLLTLYAFIRGVTSSHRVWFAASVGACFLGMMSKSVMITAPLMVLLYDRIFLTPSFGQIYRERKYFYVTLMLSWLVLTRFIFYALGWWEGPVPELLSSGLGFKGWTVWEYFKTQPGVVLHYLKLFFWPRVLCFHYVWPEARGMAFYAPAIIITALIAGVWILARRRPWAAYAALWFFVILIPTSSFFPIKEAASEHRMYLSLAALSLAVTAGLWGISKTVRKMGGRSSYFQQGLFLFLTLTLAAPLLLRTIRRHEDYNDKIRLWSSVLAVQPHNPRAYNEIALGFMEKGKADAGIRYLERALFYRPGFADAHINLGVCYEAKGDFPLALRHYQRALELRPQDKEALNNLGNLYAKWQRYAEAETYYQKALSVDPDYSITYNNLGALYLRWGRYDQAEANFKTALRLDPTQAAALKNLGYSLAVRERKKFQDGI